MKLIDILKQRDKQKHFAYGFMISLTVGTYCGWWVGFVAAFMASLGKEYYDSKGNGSVEALDVVFTCVGALMAIPITYNRNKILQWTQDWQ